MAHVPYILIVDDDPAQRELLRYNMQAEGFRVSIAENGEQALEAVQEDPPDVVVMDWMMPIVSGFEACRRLKRSSKTSTIGVLLLSARAEEEDRVRGLEVGADDYMVKPYSVKELIARIRALLRRIRPSIVGEVLSYQDIHVDCEKHLATRAGQTLKLGPLEYKLLSCFLEKPGRVWSREQLLDVVWGRNHYVDTRTVDVHVGRLRKTLTEHGGADPIRTVRGTGYSLN